MDGNFLPPGQPVYEVIGVGFGPSNIALAIALEEQGRLDGALFLEARSSATWHPDMALSGADIQHNPLRDFVTPRNPQSPYGFLSYLKAQGRLLEFLNLEAPYPPRSEYLGYVKWVAAQFDHALRYDSPVDQICRVTVNGEELLSVSSGGQVWLARNVSIGTGRSAHIPPLFEGKLGPRVIHLNDYLPHAKAWVAEGLRHVTVIGSSQSAAEIVLDLLARDPDLRVTNISRSFGFKQKDLSPFTERIYLPEFVDYFYNAGEEKQHRMTTELWRSNYGAADHDVIQTLNMVMYEQLVTGEARLDLQFNQRLTGLDTLADGRLRLTGHDHYTESALTLETDAIVLATGFRNFGAGDGREALHPVMAGLAPLCAYRADGGVAVNRDYSLRFADDRPSLPKVFLNGLCESSHGFGDAGSFSLLWVRSTVITDNLCPAPAAAAALV